MLDTIIAEAHAALAAHGLQARRLEVLSPPGEGRKRERCTLRAETDVASTVKLRRLESVAEASRLEALRGSIEAAFSTVIGRHRAVLLEIWIAGEPLSVATAAARAEEAGAILGRLHATELPGGPARVPTYERRARAAEQIRGLCARGVVAPEIEVRLLDELQRTDPGDAPQGVVHLDYCPENLVAGEEGGLHVIDNEWMRIDALGLDLGRTLARWPMDADTRTRFLRGYRSTAPCAPGALRFWTIVMAAAGAAMRLETRSGTLGLPLVRLHEAAAAPES